ncbi:MAG: hypothetical protein A2888_00490 [Chlamydiae bacterium RIFCSPLOWO2_01_FULL_28_7]|nr:MAG: hypothetical protein A2888_00490 [Chlamydiae bacterium RIFCSPLOWO2_01_FULL_28_7]
MNLKSERLKKLELELEDLQKWLNLGLVPKKDIEKHNHEIKSIHEKINEEKQRLKFMKENGDVQDYVAPKKSQKQAYSDAQTLPDMDVESDIGFDDTESFETSENSSEEHTFNEEEEDEEDPFSDKNRWKRGILEDPDADNW